MTHSETIGQIAAALAATQGRMRHALKDTTGQIGQQKTKYADLASCWEACREPLAENGLSVAQTPSTDGPKVSVATILMHKSGEWIASELTMTSVQNTPQAIGSCITYARRYSLASIVGISPEDDDGALASGTNRGSKEAAQEVAAKKLARRQEPELGITEADMYRPEMEPQSSISFSALAKFKDIKKALDKLGAEARYYAVLKQFGAEKANGLTDRNEAAAFKALGDALQATKLELADREETDKLYASLVVNYGEDAVIGALGREGFEQWVDVPAKQRDDVFAAIREALKV